MSITSVTQSVGAISGQASYDPFARANAVVPSTTVDTASKIGTERADNSKDAMQAKPEKAGDENLADAVKKANQTIQLLRSNLQFSVDEATGIDVVKFIDTQTKEVIRQIPSEEMLSIAHRLDELTGMLIRDKA